MMVKRIVKAGNISISLVANNMTRYGNNGMKLNLSTDIKAAKNYRGAYIRKEYSKVTNF